MNIDGSFSENSVIAENISSLSERESVIYEMRICELSASAEDAALTVFEMLGSGYGAYEALYVISEGIRRASASPHDEHLPENRERLIEHIRLLDAFDKIVFSELLSDKLRKMGRAPRERDFLSEGKKGGVIAYVKNPLADEAYDVFSQEIDEPRLKYCHSLAESARCVSSGETEFALLPLEERGGARLASVMELLFREDIRIASVTPVFGFEGNADMKYALVSKAYFLPTVEAGDDRYLEIRMRADASIPLSELFLATDKLGINIYRINTISFETDEGSAPYYSIVFRDDGGDFSGLLLYLTLFAGTYTTVGLYKNLE